MRKLKDQFYSNKMSVCLPRRVAPIHQRVMMQKSVSQELTRLSAREDFIEFCRPESFRIYKNPNPCNRKRLRQGWEIIWLLGHITSLGAFYGPGSGVILQMLNASSVYAKSHVLSKRRCISNWTHAVILMKAIIFMTFHSCWQWLREVSTVVLYDVIHRFLCLCLCLATWRLLIFISKNLKWREEFGRPERKRDDTIELREDVGRILLTRIGSNCVFC